MGPGIWKRLFWNNGTCPEVLLHQHLLTSAYCLQPSTLLPHLLDLVRLALCLGDVTRLPELHQHALGPADIRDALV